MAIPPVGRCIYCGTSVGRLTKEHIIPRLLGGNLTLPKASCDDCAAVTSRIELQAGRQIFQDVRLKFNMQMKKRPTHLPMLDSFEPSPELAVARLVPTKNVPGILLLFDKEPAGILTGKAPGSRFHGEPFSLIISSGIDDTTEARARDGHPGKLFRQLNIDHLGRLLGKIALGLAVAACGVDGFTSEMRDVVLKDGADWPFWIGGTTPLMDEFPPPTEDIVLHRTVVFGRHIEGQNYLLVQLQLLAFLGTPIYTVVVGALNDKGIDRLNSGD